MKEYTSHIKFAAGLRPDESVGLNNEFLTTAYNVVIKDRIFGYESLVNPVTDPGGLVWPITIDWPFPQLFLCRGGKFLASKLGIYVLDSNFIPTIEVGVDFRDTIWSVADFDKYVVFSNGAMIYIINPDNNDLHPYIGSDIPVCGYITNFRGQLVAGRVSGYPGNMLVYGEIGNASMILTKSAVAGSLPMPSNGDILALKSLGEFLAVYSTNGIAIVHPYADPIVTYGIVKHFDIGIAGAGCVTGSETTHVFLDNQGYLRTLSMDGNMLKLGYQEYMTNLTNGTIMMSYDEINGYTYISDGSKCYLLTDKGLSEIFQRPTSVGNYFGNRYGIFSEDPDYGWRVVTDTVNFGNSSRKTIQSMEIQGTGNSIAVGSYVKNLYVGAFGIPQVRMLNPRGQTRLHLSGVQFRPLAQGLDRTNLMLDVMRVSWKQTDKTFIRGAYATETSP